MILFVSFVNFALTSLLIPCRTSRIVLVRGVVPLKTWPLLPVPDRCIVGIRET